MALDLNTQERRGAYDANRSLDVYLVGGGTRPSGIGNVALHLYPTGFLRMEIVGINGSDTLDEQALARPWSWRDKAMDVRFALYRTLEDAQEVHVRLSAARIPEADYRSPGLLMNEWG